MAQILNTVNVTMQFAGLTAVDNVNIDQQEGEILALIGPNGAGKTTLFNMLTGVYKPTSGEIFYKGENITGLKPFQLVRKGITRTFQNIRLFKDMTALENLLVASPDCKDENILAAVFGGRSLLQRIGHLRLGQGNRIALFPLGQFKALVQSLLKLAIAHLFEDVGIPRLVDLEGFAAVGADDFVHGDGASLCGRVGVMPQS